MTIDCLSRICAQCISGVPKKPGKRHGLLPCDYKSSSKDCKTEIHGGLGSEDVLLRDPFVDGLLDTTLRRELRTKLLLPEDLTFATVLTRVEVYVEEDVLVRTYAVHQTNPLVQPSAASWPYLSAQPGIIPQENVLEHMKSDLRKELVAEFREQFTSLSRKL